MVKRLLCGITALVVAASASASSELESVIPRDSALRYGVLDNGLTYYIRENKTVPNRADFYIAQNVGAIMEEDNQNGLAHFLEHMAFNGTKNFPGKLIINYLESIGVQFGADINAYTSLDETVYNLKNVPTIRESIVDSALMVLHDWSGFITLDGSEIDKERGVIREEWRTRMDASRRLWKASLPIIYPNSQYAKRDVIGDTAIINHFDHDTLRAYYHRWYRPDLQAIVIVGDIDVDKVETKIQQFWTDIPKRVNPDERRTYPVEKNSEPIVAILKDKEAKNASIKIEYRHPVSAFERATKESRLGYLIMLTQELITNMFSDRLDEISAKADAPFAAAYTGYGEVVRPIEAFTTIVIPHEGKEETSFITMMTEIERIKRFGFTESELERAKLNMLSSYEKAYNERFKNKNNSYVNEYVRNFLDKEPVPGIVWEYAEIQRLFPLINLNYINQATSSFFVENSQAIEPVVLMTGPDKSSVLFPTREKTLQILEEMKSRDVSPYQESTIASSLISDKLKPQKVKSKRTNPDLVDVTEWVLGNGMKVVLKPTQLQDDEILLYGYSEGGFSKVKEDADMPSAILCASIAENNGMGNFNAIELTKALAGKSVKLQSSVTMYEEHLSGKSNVRDFETLLQLVYLSFKGTRKDDDSYQALMNQYATILANRKNNPTQAFRDSISYMVNGHHPRSFSIDDERLKKVSQEKALAIFDERFEDPKDFTFYLVGNIDLKEIQPLVEKYLGGIPVQKRMNKEKWSDMGIRTPKGKDSNEFSKEMQVEKNSNFILFSGEMDYTLKNRLILRLIADVLDIRYLESMREDEGGTYGVGVRASLARIPVEKASLQMSFDTDPKLQDKLMSLIHKEIEILMENGPIDSDFQKVKSNLKNNYEDALRSNSHVLNELTTYYNDGFNFGKDYLRILESITKEDMQMKLKELISQGNELKVIMKSNKR